MAKQLLCSVCGAPVDVPAKYGRALTARHGHCKPVVTAVPTEGTARSPRWGAFYQFFQNFQKSSTSG